MRNHCGYAFFISYSDIRLQDTENRIQLLCHYFQVQDFLHFQRQFQVIQRFQPLYRMMRYQRYPQLLRHFGIEPEFYDLVVVKANTSFKVPYSAFADEFYYADTPGAGASNLCYFKWKNLPKKFYPFDLPDDYIPEPSRVWRV